jgi:hypothetical protein
VRQQRAKNVSVPFGVVKLGQPGVKTTDDRSNELMVVKSLKEMR